MMRHEDFPVAGFEFMDEPATEDHKRVIRDLAADKGIVFAHDRWPDPFSKWDAARMIEDMKEDL